MSVSTVATKVTYDGNGSRVNWDITFPYILTNPAIQVILTDTLGVDAAPLTANYEVDAILNRVVYPTAVSGLPSLPAGWKITLQRANPLTQELVLQNKAPFNAANIMEALDKLTLTAQEMQEELNRAPKQRSSITAAALTLPLAVTGKVIGWAADGSLTNIDPGSIAGLGTLATQDSDDVVITGGTISGLSAPLPVASGGTGQITLQAAMNALAGSGTNEHVLTKDTSTGNIMLKAVPTGLMTSAGGVDYQTSLVNQFAIGAVTAIGTAKFSLTGTADVIQAIIRGNATQTAAIFQVQKSDGTVAMSVSNVAGTTFGGTTSQIKDSNGNSILKLPATAAAVNQLTINNSATGLPVKVEATGTDTHIGIDVDTKGNGVFRTLAAHQETEVTLTDGATPAVNFALGNVQVLVATANRTIAVGTNPPAAGYSYKGVLKHTASGGAWTLAFNTGAGGWAFGSDFTGPTATASGKTDVFPYIWDHTIGKMLVLGQIKGY